MPTFRFRLATLLRMREIHRDECRLALAERERDCARIVHRISELEAARVALRQQSAMASRPGRLDILALRRREGHQSTLERQHAEALAAQCDIAAQVEAARVALVEADREVKTLEKLRDSQQHSQRMATGRRERRELDSLPAVVAMLASGGIEHTWS